jgi:hypothetical protein
VEYEVRVTVKDLNFGHPGNFGLSLQEGLDGTELPKTRPAEKYEGSERSKKIVKLRRYQFLKIFFNTVQIFQVEIEGFRAVQR